jgi:hypothetical protein
LGNKIIQLLKVKETDVALDIAQEQTRKLGKEES